MGSQFININTRSYPLPIASPPKQDHRAHSDSSSRQRHPTTFPALPQAAFPIPQRWNTENSSGTSFSGSKRKYAADDGSTTGRSRTRASSTSDFTNNKKALVREQYNDKCWHCGASPADICYVNGSRYSISHDGLSDGSIDFQGKQPLQDTIALCGTCHTNFDHVYDPSFFFLPTDLDYFLNYERQDRKRRRKLGRRTGTVPARMCPTAQTYQDHQIHQRVEGAELGGLYTRIVLTDFLPQYPGRAPFQPGPSEYGTTKSWTGSPMASLQHAVLMLRKLNLQGVPRDIRDDLRRLQDAYSEELNLDDSETSSQDSMEIRELEEGDYGENWEEYEFKRGEMRTTSQQGGKEQRLEGGNAEQCDEEQDVIKKNGRQSAFENDHSEADPEVAFSHQSLRYDDIESTFILGNNSSQFWCWGPSATSNDAADFYQRVVYRLS